MLPPLAPAHAALGPLCGPVPAANLAFGASPHAEETAAGTCLLFFVALCLGAVSRLRCLAIVMGLGERLDTGRPSPVLNISDW